jgi:hypothetical protein
MSNMGELLDALKAADSDAAAPTKSVVADLFSFASQKVNEAIDAAQEPGMPLDTVSRWARKAPLQALAAAFLSVQRRRCCFVGWRSLPQRATSPLNEKTPLEAASGVSLWVVRAAENGAAPS